MVVEQLIILQRSNSLEYSSGKITPNDSISVTCFVSPQLTIYRPQIHFSALWCPPCKAFSPDLIDFYDLVDEANRDTLEIVFVSSDTDFATFTNYFSDMPWTAVPYDLSLIKNELITRFGTKGLPNFIVLSGIDGSVIDLNARVTILAAKSDYSKALDQWGAVIQK